MERLEPTRWKEDRSIVEGPGARAVELLRDVRPTAALGDRAVDRLLQQLHENVLDAPASAGLLSFARKRWRLLGAAASALIGLNIAFATVVTYRARVRVQAAPASGPPAKRARVSPGETALPRPPVVLADDPPPAPVVLPPAASLSERRPTGAIPARGRSAAIDSLAQEATLVSSGLRELRGGGDARGALGTLQGYLARYPSGALRGEAEVGELTALMSLGRTNEALALLDGLAVRDFAEAPRADELRVLRGELLVQQGRCGEALASFRSAPGGGSLRERALYGSAICRAQLGDPSGSRNDFEQLLLAFPDGAHAAAARQALR